MSSANQSGGGSMVTPIHVRLPGCRTCGREAYVTPDCLTLIYNTPGIGTTYRWACPWCNAKNTNAAHAWAIESLTKAGVRTVEAADQFAADIEDDDAVAAELSEAGDQ